jgi:nitroreductase
MTETTIPESTLVSLVRSGIAAPSADNQHHVRFALRPNTLRMFAAPSYLACKERHRRLLTQMSFGCIAENMVLAANKMGLELDLKWNADPQKPQLLADMHLHRSQKSSNPSQDILADMIPIRCTNRRFYGKRRVPDTELLALSAEVTTQSGFELMWLESERRAKATHLVRIAETERFRRQYLHEELFSAVNFNVGWRAACEHGIAPGALAVEFGMRRAFQLLSHWPLMRILNLIGTHFGVGFRAGYLPCRLAPHLGVIVFRGAVDANVTQAGRAFQRMWLRAAALGVSLQPMAASVIFPFHDADTNSMASLRRHLVSGWQEILGEATPIMLFRMGYAAKPAITSGRPNAELFLASAGEFNANG